MSKTKDIKFKIVIVNKRIQKYSPIFKGLSKKNGYLKLYSKLGLHKNRSQGYTEKDILNRKRNKHFVKKNITIEGNLIDALLSKDTETQILAIEIIKNKKEDES